jgi:hypothetical protein
MKPFQRVLHRWTWGHCGWPRTELRLPAGRLETIILAVAARARHPPIMLEIKNFSVYGEYFAVQRPPMCNSPLPETGMSA